jgi:hypothetical protein
VIGRDASLGNRHGAAQVASPPIKGPMVLIKPGVTTAAVITPSYLGQLWSMTAGDGVSETVES